MKQRDFEPWRVRLRELRLLKNLSYEKIAELAGASEDTVCNVFSGDTRYPRIDTMESILGALECTWDDVFMGSDAVICSKAVRELQQKYDAACLERDDLAAEVLDLKEKNTEMLLQVTKLTSEIEKLQMQVAHKDELIEVYKSFNK